MSFAVIYYLIGVIGSISSLSTVIMILASIGLLICLFIYIMAEEGIDDKALEKANKTFKPIMICFCVSVFLCTIMPTKKDAVIMVGLHIGESKMGKVLDEVGDFYGPLKDYIIKEISPIEEKK